MAGIQHIRVPSAAAGAPANEPVSPNAGTESAVIIARLEAELAAKARIIREQEAALAHSRKTFARASEAARIGVWECDLPDQTLRWTDVVYDIFDLPRGSALDRNHILTCYSERSREELHRLRSQAIAERSGFGLDAEIVTAAGRRRWIRITATVECENGRAVRIFGMKQDITEEKILADRTRYLAEFDVMTGLSNRARFQARLAELESSGPEASGVGALLLVDLDGFKQVNDTYGHALGDECLKLAAQRLARACRKAELVARIGGDEFAVLVGPDPARTGIERLANAIVRAVNQPVELGGETLRLGASVGIAHANACAAEELFMRADAALYAAKAAGRNTFRIFGPATPTGRTAEDGAPLAAPSQALAEAG